MKPITSISVYKYLQMHQNCCYMYFLSVYQPPIEELLQTELKVLKRPNRCHFFGNDGDQIFICGKKVVLRPFALGWMTFPSSIAVKSMIRLYHCVDWYMRGTSTTLYRVI